MSGSPTTSVDRIYTRRNEAPPCSPVKAGNFQILPNPTDDPSVAANMPRREANRSREVSAIISSDKIRACPRKAAVKRRPVNITPTGLRQETVPFHPFSSPTGLLSARPAQRIRRSSLSSAVRFYSVLCYGEKHPTQDQPPYADAAKESPCFQPYPRKKLSSVFPRAKPGLSTSAKPTSTPKSSCRVPG